MVKPSGQAAARPKALDPEDTARRTEQRILDAAHTVFMRRGSAGARMQEIAREAGVNSALLHYYFRSKERLSAAVFQRAASELLPVVFKVLASDRSLEEKVRTVIDVELTRLLATPYLPGYILSELAHRPERMRELVAAVTGRVPEEVGRSVVATLRAQINAKVRARQMRAVTPEEFVVNLLSLCIFPFAARPMINVMLGLDDTGFGRFIARRRRELPVFFLKALRP
jgi:TetR/AcrR family transcriptional regulator